MRRSIRKIPFPMVGYVLILLGFVGLGLFVAALALDSEWATALGLAMVSAYGAGTACFLIRRWRRSHPTHSSRAAWFGSDPWRYRPTGPAAVREELSGHRRRGPAPRR